LQGHKSKPGTGSGASKEPYTSKDVQQTAAAQQMSSSASASPKGQPSTQGTTLPTVVEGMGSRVAGQQKRPSEAITIKTADAGRSSSSSATASPKGQPSTNGKSLPTVVEEMGSRVAGQQKRPSEAISMKNIDAGPSSSSSGVRAASSSPTSGLAGKSAGLPSSSSMKASASSPSSGRADAAARSSPSPRPAGSVTTSGSSPAAAGPAAQSPSSAARAAEKGPSSNPAGTAGSSASAWAGSPVGNSFQPSAKGMDGRTSESSSVLPSTTAALDPATAKSADKAAPKVAEQAADKLKAAKATDKAAARPVPSSTERKPAIWASITATGQVRNSPALPPKPSTQQPAKLPVQGSPTTNSAAQGKEQLTCDPTVTPVSAQSEAAMMTYIRRPQVDAAGRATGGMEIVPAPAVPAGNNTGTAMGSNVVPASEALSRAAGKPGALPTETGAVPSQPRAASGKAGTTSKQAGAVPSLTGASSGKAGAAPSKAGAASSSPDAGQSTAEDCWKQSKLERSSSWKTR